MPKKIKLSKAKKLPNEQSDFTKKWAQIEKKQKRNKAFEKKLANFYADFCSDIQPEEEVVCELIAQETRHLMTFISRKSFTQWQREELHTWINDNLDLLTSHPFCPDHLRNVVHAEYSEALLESAKSLSSEFDTDEIDEMRDLVEDIFDEDREFTDEQLKAFLRDPATFQAEVEHYLNNQEDFDPGDDFDDQFEDDFSEEYFFNSEQKQGELKQKKLKDLFNASLLKKCFKSLASRLHPDKELDPTLKAEKSALMVKLVEAKKKNDAFAIISMYQQYIPDNELNLDKNITKELLDLLTEKLEQLDIEYRALKYSNSIESMVWQKLGGRTKKEMQDRREDHLNDLFASQVALKHVIDNTKTMKPLNEMLSERVNSRRNSPFQNFDDLMKLFEDNY